MSSFMDELTKQRWDDHRFYHHSRINQSLHLVSAISFVAAYVLLLVDPIAAALVGWCVSMTSRQIGHFFFEPKTFDEFNQATHQHKEEIKVGYNLQRKAVLTAAWAAGPIALLADPTLFGTLTAATSFIEYLRHVGLLWLALGVGALLFRTVQLFFIRDVQTGLVWATKILTDPFNDIRLYYKAPMYLMQGQLIEPRGQHK
jgi:hypothetical protein